MEQRLFDTEADGPRLELAIQPLVKPVPPDESCLEAARLMRSENIGSIVVAREGVPVGLVTDRDLAMRVLADAQDPAALRVEDVMSPHPIFISERRSLDEAIVLMRDLGVRRLPVVNERRHLTGIVSLDDGAAILNALNAPSI